MVKKFIPLFFLLIVLSLPSAAAELQFTIGMNGVTKRAPDISPGEQGINVTAEPNINTALWRLYSVNLAVFSEKDNKYDLHKTIQTVKKDNNANIGLNFKISFGNTADYEKGVKYRIAIRYTYQSVYDDTIFFVPDESTNDGWKLVGETNPNTATENGFYFTVTAADFDMEITSLRFYRNGYGYVTAAPSELTGPWLWLGEAAAKDTSIAYTAENPVAKAVYSISNSDGTEITSGNIPEEGGGKLTAFTYDTKGEILRLTLFLTDIYGNKSSRDLTFNFDSTKPIAEIQPQYIEDVPINDNVFYEKWKFVEDTGVNISSGTLTEKYKGSRYTMTVKGSEKSGKTSVLASPSGNIEDGLVVLDITVVSNVFTAKTENLTVYDRAGNSVNLSGQQHLYDNSNPQSKILSSVITPKEWSNKQFNTVVTEFSDDFGIEKAVGISPGNTAFEPSSINPDKTVNTFYFEIPDTGKLVYKFKAFDISKPTDKAANSQDVLGSGRTGEISAEYWIDRKNPTIYTNVTDGGEYELPKQITISASDLESSAGKGDASGIKTLEYSLTKDADANWQTVSGSSVTLSLNDAEKNRIIIRATDYAGNVTVTESMTLSLIPSNDNHAAEISGFNILDNYRYTLANETSNGSYPVYIVKPSAYSAKYALTIDDEDSDSYKLKIKLRNSAAETDKTVNVPQKGLTEFSLSYFSDASSLPDGLYNVLCDLTEIKPGGSEILTLTDIKVGEIAIKRTACKDWTAEIEGGTLYWKMSHENLENGLNAPYLIALEKNRYKVDGGAYTNAAVGVSGYFEHSVNDETITALHTDCAGNESVLTRRLNKQDDGNGNNIGVPGSDATLSRSRVATTYYIGTRRPQTSGVDNSKLTFAR